MKNLTFEEKLLVAAQIGRLNAKSEVDIARERLVRAKVAYTKAESEIAEQFDLDCWNGFVSEFSEDEILSALSFCKHRVNYREIGINLAVREGSAK